MDLNIIQWNINGYLNNYNHLLILIKSHNPKIITIQESHINSSNINSIPIPINYSLYNTNSSQSWGGSAILVHNSIQHKQILLNNDFDAIGIEVISKLKFTIVSAYIPPNFNFSLQNLSNVLISTIQTNAVLITGDFNSRHLDWGSDINNSKGNIMSHFISSNNFILLNDGSPTHFSTHNSFTHIDLSFCTPILKIHSEWSILDDLHGSDHFPIIIKMFPHTNSIIRRHKPKYNFKKANWLKFSESTKQITNSIPISNNINKEAANIKRIFCSSANTSIPKIKINKNSRNVPWWNSQIQSLKEIKIELWREFNRNINKENLLKYKKANAQYKRQIKITKKESIEKFTSEINPSSSPTKIWSNIRRFCGYKSSHGIHCISTPQNTTTDRCAIANLFCNQWSSNSNDSQFPLDFQNKKQQYNNFIPAPSTCPIANIIEKDISYVELLSALNKLKGHTPGFDGITYPMIRNVSFDTKIRILNLYNSIFNAFIPQIYKTSVVIPILKPKKDKTAITSYRPISLNSCLSKLLDKIIANRLWWFLENKKLIHSHQTGFQKRKSISENLLFIDYLLCHELSHGHHASIISLDFEQAFDKIGIHSILEQLQIWNVGPKIFNYVKHFMQNRKIVARIDSQYSDFNTLYNGIPQGSPLSVVLFIIAYNKLADIITLHKEVQFCAYADDFVLIVKSKTKNPKINLDSLFNDIFEWCSTSGARLSLNKCKQIHFCRKHDCSCNIEINNFQLEQVDNIKILGITFNKRYLWNTHIQNLSSALKVQLNIIKCLSTPKFNCNTQTLVNVANALVISKLSFGIQIYGFAPPSTLKKIDVIVNCTFRTVLGAYRTTRVDNILFEANIAPLEIRRDLICCKQFKSCLNSNNTPLKNIVKKLSKQNKILRIIPSISRTFLYCTELEIPLTPSKQTLRTNPPWSFKKELINKSLHKYTKQDTPIETYQVLFNEMKNVYKDTQFIYTDGSKKELKIGYSVIREDSVIKVSHLPIYSTVFSAEIIAIHEAINYSISQKKKTVIFTDSLSAIHAIENTNNSDMYPNLIRNQLLKHYPQIKIAWIPGHAQIKGNEIADAAAKYASYSPTEKTPNFNIKDINTYIKTHYKTKQNETFSKTSDWYRRININKLSTKHFLNCNNESLNRFDFIKFERLRLGHTKITHEHLMSGNNITHCIFCNGAFPVTLIHIFKNCDYFKLNIKNIFENKDPINLLINPSIDTIKLFIKFLKISNLYYII